MIDHVQPALDPLRVQKLGQDYPQVQQELVEKMNEWASAAEEQT